MTFFRIRSHRFSSAKNSPRIKTAHKVYVFHHAISIEGNIFHELFKTLVTQIYFESALNYSTELFRRYYHRVIPVDFAEMKFRFCSKEKIVSITEAITRKGERNPVHFSFLSYDIHYQPTILINFIKITKNTTLREKVKGKISLSKCSLIVDIHLCWCTIFCYTFYS